MTANKERTTKGKICKKDRSSGQMKSPKGKKILPMSFQPHHFSVIIGKGRDARNAPGTQLLREAINSKLDVYKNTSRRLDKAEIVSELLAQQQQRCPNGGVFVKHDGRCWWELSEHDARENITAAFRNRLHDNYTSSSKFKSAKRRIQMKMKNSTRDHDDCSGENTAIVLAPKQGNKEPQELVLKKSLLPSSGRPGSTIKRTRTASPLMIMHSAATFKEESSLLAFPPITTKEEVSIAPPLGGRDDVGMSSNIMLLPLLLDGGIPLSAPLLNKEEDNAAMVSSAEDEQEEDDDDFGADSSASSLGGTEFHETTPINLGPSFGTTKDDQEQDGRGVELLPSSTKRAIGMAAGGEEEAKTRQENPWSCLPPILLSADSMFGAQQVTTTGGAGGVAAAATASTTTTSFLGNTTTSTTSTATARRGSSYLATHAVFSDLWLTEFFQDQDATALLLDPIIEP